MVGDQAMSARIAIGVGCRLGCPADTIEALIHQALSHTPIAEPLGRFTISDKREETGLTEAAGRLGLSLMFLTRDALREQAPFIRTHSATAERLFGLPSVAEAAALAGAGPGSTLVVPRISSHGATCAIAAARDDTP